VIIRKATIRDFEKIKQIRAEFFLLEASTDKYVNPEWVKRGMPIAIGKGLRNKNEQYHIAEEDGQLIGFAASEIIKNPHWAKHKELGHLYNLYVIPKYQGKGIGTKLLEKALEWLKERKIKDIKILTYAENKKAQKLYKRYGFSDYMITMKKLFPHD